VSFDESTTPDLVERSREMLEAANGGDFDAVLSFYAPDAVWESWMVGDPFKGRAAIRDRIEDWLGVFEALEFEIEEIFDLGRGVVFAVVRQDARPVGSAAHVSTREAWVVVWEQGMIVRRVTFADIEQGRAAAERAVESRTRADA
jgi:ketosteroid isomerase-like protein